MYLQKILVEDRLLFGLCCVGGLTQNKTNDPTMLPLLTCNCFNKIFLFLFIFSFKKDDLKYLKYN